MASPVLVLRKIKTLMPPFLIVSFILADIIFGIDIIVKLEGQPWYSLPVGIILVVLVGFFWLSSLKSMFDRVNVYHDKLVERGLFMTHRLYFKDIGRVNFEIRRGHSRLKLYVFYDKQGTEIWRIASAYLLNKKVKKEFFQFLRSEIQDIELDSKIIKAIEN